ncbi:MAG: 4-hydroxythreonine-4-phosphate dehydrogenase PdxA [Rhodobacteraceae bacterium]|nr:4-hydroxythreonine-4-phosphate dehydrogenase PdxA [Paracoccaceae bacterium]
MNAAQAGRLPIALTCGEPAGIGPEIAAKAWVALRADLPFAVIGDARHFTGFGVPVARVPAPADALHVFANALPVLDNPFPAPATPGRPTTENAQSVINVIARGADLVSKGKARALTTAPIHKKALQDGAGFRFPGHTEYLAHLTGTDRVVMMLASDLLRVVATTIHIPLAEVPRTLTPELLGDTIRITAAGLAQDLGIKRPRLAVAGLNPHAGEGGAIGREDIEVIAPVIAALAAEGLAVTGPHSADTLFHAAARRRYDAVVAMYHDQALIPIKTLAFETGVNVTLGLPFVRTSPDHGTALDIAGTGQADPQSLIEALKRADEMACTRARYTG